uniref:Uncharacterized protein n=1 Tax=viral metagenome TaxID=1070528 RepID=A0A6C0DLI4_9ZZZZ
MKYNKSLLVFAVIIFLVIAISVLVGSNAVMPYSQDTLFSIQYPFEGFQGVKPLEYTTNNEHNAIDSYSSFLINNQPLDCKKVWGFDGLYCKPYVADNKLDVFSEAEGKKDCKGVGLTNSLGNLCLNDVQKKLLTTRGGNSTGKDSEIGK